MTTVAPLLDALVCGSADDERVTVADVSLTFGELRQAAHVVAREVAWHHRVAVLARATLPTVVAVVGGLLAGVCVVPVADDSGSEERAHILRDSGAEAWVGEPPSGSELPVVPVDLNQRRGLMDRADTDPDADALVLYTSGTTGPPKGVVHSRESLRHGVHAVRQAWDWTAADTLVHGLPLYHVHGLVLGVLGPLTVGSAFVHTGRPTPQAYAAAGGSLYFGVPTVWHRVAEDADAARALAPARLLVSGSAPLPAPLFERLRALTGHEMVERYGMTESLITISARVDRDRRPGWVGWPVEGVETRICGEGGEPVPHDGESVGALQLRGPTMFRGYLGRPEATSAAYTEDGWFTTGDVASIAPDGCHRIVGRESVDLIKTGGFRVGAGEIETELISHPGVREAAVVGLPDEDLGQRIVAYVVLAEGGDGTDAAALSTWVAGRLSAHKRPREVRVVTALPRNSMGKVVKTELG